MKLRHFAVAAVVLGVARSAHAEPSPPASSAALTAAAGSEKSLEDARRHFGRGVQLYRDRDFRGALAEFNRAYSIGPSYRILYNIGQAELELQDHAAALKTFARYLKDGGDELTPSKRDEVQAILARYADRIAEVRVRVSQAGAEVFVDDVSAGRAPLAEPLIVSAGRHRFTAVADGAPVALQIIEVAGGDHTDVELSFAAPVVVAREPAQAIEPIVTAAPRAPRVPPAAPAPSRAPFWISLGVTGAVGVATLTTGLLAISAKRTLADELDRFPTDEARVRSARSGLATTALATDVLAAVTLVGIGVTTYFALTTRKSPSAGSVQVGLGAGSIVAQGQFQ